MSRFYINSPLNIEKSITLSDDIYNHWIKVLRANIGDTAILFNGLGGEYNAQLIDINKNSALVKLLDYNPSMRIPKCRITLGQVMSKGDRMDYAIAKATELGVAEIQLLTSERCEMRLKYERDQKKMIHWQQIAISSCEQCGMNRIPTILPPMPLLNWLQNLQASLKLVLALNIDTARNPLPADTPDTIALLVGPEGGLSSTEVNMSTHYGFNCWQLGERVLRTETAPLVAMSILNSYF